MDQAIHLFPKSYQADPNRVPLLCWHHAGGGTAHFHRWAAQLSPAIHVIPMCLPGREYRFHEAPFRRLHEVLEHVVPEILLRVQAPVWLFGQSLGGLIAYEVAQALGDNKPGQVAGLIAASCAAPRRIRVRRPLTGLPDEEFLNRLIGDFGLIGKDAQAETDLMRLMLPTLRADIEIMETYKHQDREPLACPISAFGGISDENVARSDLQGWREHTVADFSESLFQGGHFFVQQRPAAVMKQVEQRILVSAEGNREPR